MADVRPKPTLKDIARLAEASPSTVSSVLNGTWRDRRIHPDTAERIRRIAAREGYSANMQARGLRRGRSGLTALLLPVHDNRFFAAMSQAFEAEVRARGQCPVVVSARRDPGEEARTVAQLISYAIDALVIAGARDPGAIGALCRTAGVDHVYVDLPGPDAPSVVSDNVAGARMLTEAVIAAQVRPLAGRPIFFGGVAGEFATEARIAGFLTALRAAGVGADPEIVTCGYAPDVARAAFVRLLDRLGAPPPLIFVNSILVFEGILPVLSALPPGAIASLALGCYDYDPVAGFLPFPVHMVRQDSEGLVSRALSILDGGADGTAVERLLPNLVAPRTLPRNPFGDLG